MSADYDSIGEAAGLPSLKEQELRIARKTAFMNRLAVVAVTLLLLMTTVSAALLWSSLGHMKSDKVKKLLVDGLGKITKQVSGVHAENQESAHSHLEIVLQQAKDNRETIESLHGELAEVVLSEKELRLVQAALSGKGKLETVVGELNETETKLTAARSKLKTANTSLTAVQKQYEDATKTLATKDEELAKLKKQVDRAESAIKKATSLDSSALTIVILFHSPDFQTLDLAQELARLFAEVNYGDDGVRHPEGPRMVLVQFNGKLRINNAIAPPENIEAFKVREFVANFFTTATFDSEQNLGSDGSDDSVLNQFVQLQKNAYPQKKRIQLTLIVPESVKPPKLSPELESQRLHVCVLNQSTEVTEQQLLNTWKQPHGDAHMSVIRSAKLTELTPVAKTYVMGRVRECVRRTMLTSPAKD